MVDLMTDHAAQARNVGGLQPLDPAHGVIAIRPESVPRRHELDAGNGPVGTLLPTGSSSATAYSASGTWRLTTQRHGLISRIAVARDATTAEPAAAFYPGLRPGGTIALHDTDFRLRLPWTKGGWWLFDESDRAVATIRSACSGGRCSPRDRTVQLQDAARDPHPDLALVLLTTLWLVDSTLSFSVVCMV
jgi:hypothetical protein